MKAGFFPKLALDAMRKNRRLYLPYLLTCIGMVMMYYIIAFLQYSDSLDHMRGGSILREMMSFGSWVIAIFAVIFLFYTNAFLIRRRKREFGLYNMLGMGKTAIGRILLWENILTAAAALVIGLLAGIAFSKLAELVLVNLLDGEITYSLSVSPAAILLTVAVFSAIFVLLFLNNLRQVGSSSAIALMRSENTGEKPPKGNWVLGVLGIAALGWAYYLAVTISDPIVALALFFVAVILVIIGTYLLMIAGSVLFCRILQKCKRYYYKPNHFVSVSSMAYRMKRNGAGLASICILATMVLVMISSTASLYFGSEDALLNRYPRDINLTFSYRNADDLADGCIDPMRDEIRRLCGSVTPENVCDYRSAQISGLMTGNTPEFDVRSAEVGTDTLNNVYQFCVIPLADYNRLIGGNEELATDEMLIYVYHGSYTADTVQWGAKTLQIKRVLHHFPVSGDLVSSVIPTFYLIVSDFDGMVAQVVQLADYNGNRMVQLQWNYQFDVSMNAEDEIAFGDRLFRSIPSANHQRLIYEGREANRDEYFGTFGSLFFLGIVLSLVFVLAAVLMIYYKQISEGYEDQARFDIMQKVGMTRRDIRRSINSQLLTVFALPLIGAGCHLAFAFPMIRKLLLLFGLNNISLFTATTAVCFGVFAFFYTVVYRITSNAYYHIVSNAADL